MSENDVPVSTQSEEEVVHSEDLGPAVDAPQQVDEEALAKLDEALAKYVDQKRWSDVIKTTIAKAELVADPTLKVELYAEAGRLYLERSSNQPEAIKCFRQVLDLDPQNREAIDRLKEMFEKRRDWERLIEIMRIEGAHLGSEEQLPRSIEIAQLATERLRKPAICIELWQDVLALDSHNDEALGALSSLYERAREWEPLAEILELQSEQGLDEEQMVAVLTKLGGVYSDKLSNDDRAVAAFLRLLQLRPDDRRAQDQIKKRYVALKDWDALEDFYAPTGKWDELIRTLERAADSDDVDVPERVELLFRVARLWGEALDKPDRAARAYEKVLGLDDTNREAAEALAPIYEAAGDARKLVGVNEIRLLHLDDPAAQVTLLRDNARLYDERLRSSQQAFESLLAAFAIDPQQVEVRSELERLSEKNTEQQGRLLEAYGKAIEGTGDEESACALRLQYGALLTQANKPDDAIAQFQAVLESRPDDPSAIEALTDLFTQEDRPGELLAMAQRRLELESDPEARRTLSYQVAALQRDHVQDYEAAVDAYRNIIIEFGEDEGDAYAALEALYEHLERWEDLAESIDTRIQLGMLDDAELCELKYRLALTCIEHLGDRPRALEVLQEVLMVSPDHVGATATLEGLLADEELGGRVAALLEPLYEQRGEHAQLVRALEVAAAHATDSETAIETLKRVVDIQMGHLGDFAAAFETASRAFQAAPERSDLLERLEGLARGQNRVSELVELLGKMARDAGDDALLARQLWLARARLQDEDANDIDGAIASYQQALKLDQNDEEVLEAIEDLYRRTERWQPLMDVLRSRAEHTTDPATQEELLSQVAFIHFEMLGDAPSAIGVYAEVLDVNPSSLNALAQLDTLYESEQMWADLADNVARRLSLVDDEHQRVALLLRLAHLREARMGALEGAIEIYREVLEADPTQPEALAAMERILAQPEHQSQIADALEPIYRDSGDFSKLVGIHEIQLACSKSADHRVGLLHQIADLYETALQDLESAFDSQARALAEDPGNPDTQSELDRLAASLGCWDKLADVYEAQAPNAADSTLGASLYGRAGQIMDEYVGDRARAVQLYRNVLSLDDRNLDAASALERLYQGGEEYEALAGVYLTKASMLDATEEKREHLFRAAAIYEELLGRPEAAIEVYQKSLEIDPEDLAALDKLIDLHLRQQNWDALLDVYTQKADIVSDPDEKKALLLEIGRVYEEQQARTEKAIETYQRVLEIDPQDDIAVTRLDALYVATEQWEELLAILEREVDLALDADATIQLKYRIGELYEQRLAEPFRAVDAYREILDVVPDFEPARTALERMIAAKQEAVAAAEVLEPIYRASGEAQRLVAVLEVLAESNSDPLRKVELLHQVAELEELHLGRSAEAFDAFARALNHDSDNDFTMESLERLAEALGSFADLARIYDAEIEMQVEDRPDSALQLALRLAGIFEVQLGDVDNAIKRYAFVAERMPNHAESLAALDRLYEATGNFPELAKVLEREAENATSDVDEAELQYRLGQVLQLQLGDVPGAIERYRDILATNPDHEAAVSALEQLVSSGQHIVEIADVLEPLYRGQEAWHKVVALADVQLQAIEDSEERSVLMQRVADIAEERAGDYDTALSWMLRAVLEEPANDVVANEAERIAEVTGDWDRLADVLARAGGSVDDPKVSAALAKRLAVTYEQRVGDVERAEESYRYALANDASDEDVLEALDRIYTEHGAGEALATLLKSRIAAANDTFDRVEFAHRLGLVLYNEVGRTQEAIEVLTQVLDEMDAEHEPSIKALENIFTATKDWPSLYGAYERELKIASGDTVRSEVLGRMAHLASAELGQPEKAVDLLRQVLDILGEEPAALNALGNLYALQENWSDLVDVLEREVAVTLDDEMRVAIHSDLGRIWYEKLGRSRSALESWERVLDVDPAAVEALFSIATVHRAAESYPDLVDTLHRVVDVGAGSLDEARLEGVLMELGSVYADKLAQPLDAAEQYRQVLDLNPHNFGAMDALERIYAADERWEDAIDVMQRRATALDDPRLKIEVLLEIADLWEGRLELPDGARSAYEQILALDPAHENAFSKLEALHRDGKRFEDLTGLYIGRVESAEDLETRVGLLHKVAEVYEKDLSDRNQAFDALLIAWQQDFTSEKTAQSLERITGLTQRWNELLTTANEALTELQQHAPEDQASQNAICVKCARWYGREGHPEYAIPYLQQVLSVDPVNRPAMMQMAELHRQTQQWQSYAQLLSRLADMTEEPAEKAETFVKMGELQEEQFSAFDQAIGHYKAALDAAPNDLAALDALARLYRKRENWPELVKVLRRRINAVGEPEGVLAAKLDLAETFEDRIVDRAKAVEQYRDVLKDDPANLPALKGLERLHAQLEQWQDLLQVLERQLELVSNERERVSLLLRLAGMWEEEFIKPDRAAERLEQVVDVDPGHEEALQSLSRLYRAQKKWHELIDTLERQIQSTSDRGQQAELHAQIGSVYHLELKDIDRAIESYLNVTEVEPEHEPSLRALAALYEARGDYSAAIDRMESLVELVADAESRVDLLYQIGHVFDARMGDRVSAVDYYQRATDIDGTHLPSLEAMRDIHLEAGEYHAAARVLERAAEAEQSPRKKAVLRVELGRIYDAHLHEREAAVEAFEQAHALDADNIDAALPLMEEYMRAERFGEAEPLLQLLVRSGNKFDGAEQHRLWFTYGECAARLGDDSAAVRAFGQAFELDSQDLPSLLGLAAAYYRKGEWDNAFKYYQMVLVHHREELGSDEITDTFFRLGVIKRELGDRRKALNMFEKALEEDSGHRNTLVAMVGLHEQQREFEQVIHFKKRILDVADDLDERFNLYSEIGELWEEKLSNPAAAIEAYVEAAELQPNDHKMLHKLLGLYMKTSQWEAVIDVISRISAVDARPGVQAKNAYTIGVILRDELKDPVAALEQFNSALDLDAAGQLKAFQAIDTLLTHQKNWKELERAYRKMLRRITGKGDPQLEFSLWHGLGVIYRDRLRDYAAAAEAFTMASRLQPENAQEHQILAEIYALVPGRVEDAIAQYQILLRQNPNDPNPYRALYKLYFESRAYDKAWCVAATLNFLQRADAEQRQFYEQYRTEGPIRPRARLSDELWVKELFHEEEDFLVGKIFESVASAILQWRKVSDKRLDLKKKQEVTDMANTTIGVARTFGFVNQVFGLPIMPRLFVCPERPMGLDYAATIPPASVCGSGLLTNISPLDAIFVVARHLSYYRGEHYVRTMLQTKDELKVALAAAMRIVGADISSPAVDSAAAEIRSRMQPAQLEVLSKVGRRFVDAGARADLKVWMRSVELTACRAGLLMCNDLSIAARMIPNLPPIGTVELTTKERLEDIILFSVSENYFRLREALGIALTTG